MLKICGIITNGKLTAGVRCSLPVFPSFCLLQRHMFWLVQLFSTCSLQLPTLPSYNYSIETVQIPKKSFRNLFQVFISYFVCICKFHNLIIKLRHKNVCIGRGWMYSIAVPINCLYSLPPNSNMLFVKQNV